MPLIPQRVLAFQKKAKKGIATPKQEIELIKRRLKDAREHAKGEQDDP